jgi:hypothetical protein
MHKHSTITEICVAGFDSGWYSGMRPGCARGGLLLALLTPHDFPLVVPRAFVLTRLYAQSPHSRSVHVVVERQCLNWARNWGVQVTDMWFARALVAWFDARVVLVFLKKHKAPHWST